MCVCVFCSVCFCSTLIQRGADFNVEDIEGARADELARQCCANDCCEVIVSRRQQHMSQLSTLVIQVFSSSTDLHSNLLEIYYCQSSALSVCLSMSVCLSAAELEVGE